MGYLLMKPRAGSLADQIHELLEIDGGWLTTSGLMLMFPQRSKNGIYEALSRLNQLGLVERRPRLTNELRTESEWRCA